MGGADDAISIEVTSEPTSTTCAHSSTVSAHAREIIASDCK